MNSIILTISFLLGFYTSSLEDRNSIEVQLEGLKENSGKIGLMVFDQAEGFPNEQEKAIYSNTYPIKDGAPKIVIEGLQPGRYAIALIHDVNDNDDLDKNFMGIPTEPIGFSGNKPLTFGPPKFEDAAFEFNGGAYESKIQLIEIF